MTLNVLPAVSTLCKPTMPISPQIAFAPAALALCCNWSRWTGGEISLEKRREHQESTFFPDFRDVLMFADSQGKIRVVLIIEIKLYILRTSFF